MRRLYQLHLDVQKSITQVSSSNHARSTLQNGSLRVVYVTVAIDGIRLVHGYQLMSHEGFLNDSSCYVVDVGIVA